MVSITLCLRGGSVGRHFVDAISVELNYFSILLNIVWCLVLYCRNYIAIHAGLYLYTMVVYSYIVSITCSLFIIFSYIKYQCSYIKPIVQK